MTHRSRIIGFGIVAILIVGGWYAVVLVVPPPARRLVEPLTIRTRLESCLGEVYATANARNRHVTTEQVREAIASDPIYRGLQWDVEVITKDGDIYVTATTSKPPYIVHPTVWERVLFLRSTTQMNWPTIRLASPIQNRQLTGDVRDGQ